MHAVTLQNLKFHLLGVVIKELHNILMIEKDVKK